MVASVPWEGRTLDRGQPPEESTVPCLLPQPTHNLDVPPAEESADRAH